jgi:hypothetical protein
MSVKAAKADAKVKRARERRSVRGGESHAKKRTGEKRRVGDVGEARAKQVEGKKEGRVESVSREVGSGRMAVGPMSAQSVGKERHGGPPPLPVPIATFNV